MKKTSIVVTLLLGALVLSSFTLYEMKGNGNPNTSVTTIDSKTSTVFRSDHKFSDNEGTEIYCYSRGAKCEWFDHDRLVLTCTYTLVGSDIRFLNEDGSTAYKGTVQWYDHHSNPASITIDGVKFKKIY